MTTTVEDLLKRAMELPAEQRAQLADELVESLDARTLTELDKQWLTIAKRRRDEVRNGVAQTVPGPHALQQVRDAIKR
jgi:hypothetical protein